MRSLPDDVPVEIRQQAERELLGYADRFDAQQLTRLGSHILTVVAPEIGEARATPKHSSGRSSRPVDAGSCSSPPTGTAPCTCGVG